MKKLTETQIKLLTEARKYTSVDRPVKYDTLKSLCNIKTFDQTFNTLFLLGYLKRVETNDYSNQFILIK